MDVFAFLPLAHPYGGGPGGWWFGGFIMFLFWIAVIFLVFRFFVVRGGRPWRDRPSSGERASDILAERYARGEIDADEFQARGQVLRVRSQQEPSPVSRARGMFAARSAQAILAERYARGEIDVDEYRERLEELMR